MTQTILVADDDQWVRVLTRDVLAGGGYRVLEASDGQHAMRVASEHEGPLHLLLSDVMMPGMNGCELAVRLSTQLPGVKVLFMSAWDRDYLVSQGFNPIGPVITKPFTTEYLLRRVSMLLSRPSPAA